MEGKRVVGTTSGFQVNAGENDIAQIGRALKVDTLLEGSVQSAGSRIRVFAQLDRTDSGVPLWSDTYERELKDLPAAEEALARDIAKTLWTRAAGPDEVRLTSRYPQTGAAYDYYLKALHSSDRNAQEGLEKSIQEYQAALESDSLYAPAMSGMAASYVALSIYRMWRPGDAAPKARDLTERALEIDPRMDVAHAILGFTSATYDWDWRKAELHFRKSIDLNPNCAIWRAWFSLYYLTTRRLSEEAHQQFSKALDLNPLEPRFQSFRIAIPLYLREYDRAIEEGHRALLKNSSDAFAHLFLGWALRQKGHYGEAMEEDLLAARMSNFGPLSLRNLGDLYGATGRKADAE